MYCVGNPMRYIDPNGMDWYETSSGNIMWKESVKSQSDLSDDEKYIGERYQGLIIKRYELTSKENDVIKALGVEIVVGLDYGNDYTKGNWLQNLSVSFPENELSDDIILPQYVDAKEKDYPFYFSCEELESQRNHMGEKWIFEDGPYRNCKSNQEWSAELSFVEQTKKGYNIQRTISYGFTIDNEQIRLKAIQYITNPSAFQKMVVNQLNGK